ncbi:hypothetical protein D5S18_18790 [Nocardia panacis]|uniref:Uncharacterized protein n=1 Tax=Nocardia panacis TaxID=2340916 RepID=A0A3A4KVL7_9NOCA|nr:hypothetical protein [Nocardia panacis]RJO74009.1 hypothetical protein D5S18_18790 [Nocardia panacis]
MGLVWFAAAAALLLLLVWWAFPTLARIIGFLVVLDSLLAIVFLPSFALPHRLAWLGLGIIVWLAGNWAWAAKQGTWGSRLAFRIFGLPGLRRLVPRSTIASGSVHDRS